MAGSCAVGRPNRLGSARQQVTPAQSGLGLGLDQRVPLCLRNDLASRQKTQRLVGRGGLHQALREGNARDRGGYGTRALNRCQRQGLLVS